MINCSCWVRAIGGLLAMAIIVYAMTREDGMLKRLREIFEDIL